MKDRILKILPTISKPTRYLGDELNAVKKISQVGLTRIALAFPDIYDVGMSHLGLKILYSILNSRDDVWAERVFAPWVDMEEKMHIEGIPLFSLESYTPLKEFDIIGFSLQYELSYTNILNMLELAQIPLISSERDKNYPLIIAGGPCAYNPEPIADFIDLFVIGDGEEVILELVDCYKSNKNRDKHELLDEMSNIEGVYVPSLASTMEQADGMITVSTIKTNTDLTHVKKRIVKNLNDAKYPKDYMVPFMRPVHDRAVIEVMRGCSRGCRFCQAGMTYRPVREKRTDVVEKLAEEIIDNTGYEELSLSSLSTCDHSSIYKILQRLIESLGEKKHVSISLPSLRADAFSVELAKQLESTGKTGLTFAPEVATERMQNVINKSIPKAELLATIESAFSSGWDSMKLYFLMGLPTETDEDIIQISYLAKEILQVALRNNRRASINVSVSNFVPKSHTPFQWEQQSSIEEIQEKQRLILSGIGKNRRINLSFTNPKVSFMEGVFARGDRRLCKVLNVAHALGCKLDGWTEFFDFDKWMLAFDKCRIDPKEYLKARKTDEALSWDHIDSGIKKDFLITERERSYENALTPDCRWGKCTLCGIQDAIGVKCWSLNDVKRETLNVERGTLDVERETLDVKRDAVTKIRFKFAKRDDLRFISHLDMINVFTRAFRRAGVPIAYSQGFSPNPKIAFGSVLPVGTTGEAEYADIDLESYVDPQEFLLRTNDKLPTGLEILEAEEVSLKAQPLMAMINMASYIVRVHGVEENPNARIQSILDMDHVWIEKFTKSKKDGSDKSKFVDVKPLIHNISLLKYRDKTMELEMVLGDGNAGKVRPEQIVQLILRDNGKMGQWDDGRDEKNGQYPYLDIEIIKTGSLIEDQGNLLSPRNIVLSSHRPIVP